MHDYVQGEKDSSYLWRSVGLAAAGGGAVLIRERPRARHGVDGGAF